MMGQMFQVFDRDGRRAFFTEDNECVPQKEAMLCLLRDGYKLKNEGKMIHKKDIDNFLKDFKKGKKQCAD